MTLGTGNRPRNRQPKGGYTLLEICLVLAILVLMVGATLPSLSSELKLANLRRSVHQFALAARTARREATEKQQAMEIAFASNGLGIGPVETAAQDPLTPPDKPLVVTLPSSLKMELRKWGETRWHFPTSDDAWLFTPSGLCEPLEVRFHLGTDSMEVRFEPLTADMVEEGTSSK